MNRLRYCGLAGVASCRGGRSIFRVANRRAALLLEVVVAFAILTAAGSDMRRVLKATVYVSDISLWPRVNAVYAEVFGEHRPARAVVPTRELHFGYQVEIEVIAACD